jgi:ABC-type sugar transport system substrate-binding protein
MRKFVSIITLVILMVVVAACGSNSGNNSSTSSASPSASSQASNDTAQSSAAPSEAPKFKTVDSKATASVLEATLGQVPQPSKPYKIGVVLKTLSNEHWQEMKKGYEEAAAKYGVTVDVQAAKDESDLTGQLQIAETMLNKGYDAIAVSPLSSSNLQPALDKAKSLNIPVINVDDSKVEATVFVGGDHREMGAMAAAYISSKLGGKGEVGQVEGQAGSPAALQRIDGYKSGMTDDLKLVASQPGDWDRLKALEATNNMLKANPNIKAIYANNDTMALGVVEALKNNKRTDIIVIGTDGVPDAIESIRKGELTGSIATFPYDMGYTAVEVTIRLLEGQEVPNTIVSRQELVDKDNVDQLFPK